MHSPTPAPLGGRRCALQTSEAGTCPDNRFACDSPSPRAVWSRPSSRSWATQASASDPVLGATDRRCRSRIPRRKRSSPRTSWRCSRSAAGTWASRAPIGWRSSRRTWWSCSIPVSTRYRWSPRRLVVASEYERLARRWIAERGLAAEFVLSYGATEVFPPEDADVIVDNTATGATLEANGLAVVDEIMRSSTRLYANPVALRDPARRRRIDDLVMLLNSVLVARRRVMLEVNASAECLDAVVAVLPSMRQATVAPLFGNGGYAVKAAVPRELLPQVIPAVKAAGGTDVVVSTLSQIVP